MAKLLLCCDEYIYKYGNKYYFRNQERCDFFYRYLRVFEEIRLVTRCKVEYMPVAGRVQMNLSEIDYVPLPFFQGPKQYAIKYFKVGKLMQGAPDGCDCALLRLPSTIAERLGKYLIKAGVPYALEIVYDAVDAWHNNTSLVGKLLWMKIDKNMKYLSKNADGISYVTEFYLQRHYHSDKKSAFTSHYSSLSLDKSFYTNARKYPCKKTMTIANVANQIAFNGRKGHNEIIQAIAKLKKEGIIVKAEFAGEDYNNGISRLKHFAMELGVKEQVEFLGYLQRKDLSRYLEDADLYVMPTKAEGLPRAIIEAMAKGLPCVTTNVSGNSELVETEFLINDYYDIDSWTGAIKKIVSNREIYEHASEYNFNHSLQYEAHILQSRRDEFYSKLKESASECK